MTDATEPTVRTPKPSTVRAAWLRAHPYPLTTDVEEREAEFDRFLAEVAEKARADERERLRTRAEVVAEHWDQRTSGGYKYLTYPDDVPAMRDLLEAILGREPTVKTAAHGIRVLTKAERQERRAARTPDPNGDTP